MRKAGSFIWWVLKLGGIPGAVREIFQVLVYLAAYGPALLTASVLTTVLDFAAQMPFLLRLAFFVGVFFCTLAIVGAILAFAIRRSSSSKEGGTPEAQAPASRSTTGGNLTQQSSDWQLWQELKRVESENEQLKATVRESEKLHKEARDWIDTITPFMRRIQLRDYLKVIHRMGSNLQAAQQPDAADMEKWVSLTSAFISRYLDDEAANFFLVGNGDYSFAGRLRRLEDIFDKPVDRGGKVQPDFDPTGALEPYPSKWAHKH